MTESPTPLPETDNRDELRRRKLANRTGQPMRSAGELAQAEAAAAAELSEAPDAAPAPEAPEA